ncbi:Ku protein [Streptomyces sp. NPDC059122]|uniref:Ku protein n=1 Tax=Streptomyces sp. NPDC059122 TaxID=3346732 RepID=UPI0036CBC791
MRTGNARTCTPGPRDGCSGPPQSHTPQEHAVEPQRRGSGRRHATVQEPPENGGRVRHQRICALDGQRLTASETARGWNTPDGRTVVVTDEDLAALPLPTKRVIEVLGFIDTNDVDPLLYACPYWVGASGAGIIRRSDGQKGFVVLPKRWIVGQRQAKKPKPVRGQRTDVTWAGLSREAWPAAFPSDFGSSGLPRPGRPGRLARRREGDALGAGR